MALPLIVTASDCVITVIWELNSDVIVLVVFGCKWILIQTEITLTQSRERCTNPNPKVPAIGALSAVVVFTYTALA